MTLTQKNYSRWFIDSVDEATILSRIRAEIDKTYAQAHAHKATSHSLAQHFQDLAAYHFAELNGWTTGPHVRSFRVEDIGKRSGDFPYDLGTALIDHPIYFRADGRCASVLAQPYEHATHEEAYAYAQRRCVACHIPPIPRASFWFPGYTLFAIYTAPDHIIRWLPEQIAGLASDADIDAIKPKETV